MAGKPCPYADSPGPDILNYMNKGVPVYLEQVVEWVQVYRNPIDAQREADHKQQFRNDSDDEGFVDELSGWESYYMQPTHHGPIIQLRDRVGDAGKHFLQAKIPNRNIHELPTATSQGARYVWVTIWCAHTKECGQETDWCRCKRRNEYGLEGHGELYLEPVLEKSDWVASTKQRDPVALRSNDATEPVVLREAPQADSSAGVSRSGKRNSHNDPERSVSGAETVDSSEEYSSDSEDDDVPD